jgi:hypothetical protein
VRGLAAAAADSDFFRILLTPRAARGLDRDQKELCRGCRVPTQFGELADYFSADRVLEGCDGLRGPAHRLWTPFHPLHRSVSISYSRFLPSGAVEKKVGDTGGQGQWRFHEAASVVRERPATDRRQRFGVQRTGVCASC